MRIELVRGSLTATAESVEDIATLMGLGKPARGVGVLKGTKRGAYKKLCPICKTKVKYLTEHTKKNHAG